MIPVLEGAKTFHASDRATTVIGRESLIMFNLKGHERKRLSVPELPKVIGLISTPCTTN
jgi:hypothetical protein